MEQLRLPVGIEDFAEIRRHGYYNVDKTQLIEQVLNRRNKVSLFTRPRRFGKTLNMSMLQHFFEFGTDPKLFQGLSISKNNELCGKISSCIDQLKEHSCRFVCKGQGSVDQIGEPRG